MRPTCDESLEKLFMIKNPVHHTATKLLRRFAFVGLFLALSACTSAPPKQLPETGISEPTAKPNTIDLSKKSKKTEQNESQLTSELLYDILVASIAARRNQPEIALDSLARAAYQSKNPRLIAESIQLAMDNEEFERAISLAKLLNTLQPENYLIILSMAKAQFSLGEYEIALNLLVDLTERYGEEQIYVFQDTASLLAAQEDDSIINDFWDLADASSDNPGLILTSALLASRLEDSNNYIQQLERVMALRPEWETPAILLLTQLINDEPDKVTSYADLHLGKFPRHTRFRLQYSRYLIQNNQLDSALVQLNEIIDIDPGDSDALYTAGLVYLEQNDLANSKDFLARHLALSPSNDQARIYLSDIEFREENYIAASNHLHGVAGQRHYLDAQIRLGIILARRLGIDSGIKHLQKIDVVAESDKIRLILEQNLLLREYDQADKAKIIFDEGLKRFPDNPDLLYNRGLLAAELELLELHEKDMRKLIEIEPDNAHAYNALGYTLADKTDRLEEAMKLIEVANSLLPNNPFILDSMGWIHFRLGNNIKALEFLRQALETRQDAEIAAHLGEVLWIIGDKDEAREIWKKGREWGPENEILKQTIERLSQQQTKAINTSPLSERNTLQTTQQSFMNFVQYA